MVSMLQLFLSCCCFVMAAINLPGVLNDNLFSVSSMIICSCCGLYNLLLAVKSS